MKEEVTAVFDIGKTNKKILLFNKDFKVISEEEQKFSLVTDEDGYECDDIELIEAWIREQVSRLALSEVYDLTAVNFTTYGATLVYLDENGNRLTPVYNYLKPIDEKIAEHLYRRYGGRDEFCRRTASPALEMLNSGIQILWLRSTHPDIFCRVRHILHFPQYLSYLLTGKIFSEHTSIGCHTALWDFDDMVYHKWTSDYGLKLPDPVPVSTLTEISIEGKKIKIGIGIHDSSSSLAPYFGNERKFILLSTGTWCINMNPFNTETLTAEQLDNDCLCYMSIERRPVKSSRLFLGHLHEQGAGKIAEHFFKPGDYFRNVKYDPVIVSSLKEKHEGKKIFFRADTGDHEFRDFIDMYEFASYEEAYHQLMAELCEMTAVAIRLVLPSDDSTTDMFITGGFSGNEIFRKGIVDSFPDKTVYTSKIANASALGAALVISSSRPEIDLGLTQCRKRES